VGLEQSKTKLQRRKTMTRAYALLIASTCALMTLGLWSGVHHVLAAGGNTDKGKAVYGTNCVACHGPQGKGDGPIGKTLKPPAADFTSAAGKQKSEAELLKIIESGQPKTSMMAWKGRLSDEQLQDVLAYVLTLRK